MIIFPISILLLLLSSSLLLLITMMMMMMMMMMLSFRLISRDRLCEFYLHINILGFQTYSGIFYRLVIFLEQEVKVI